MIGRELVVFYSSVGGANDPLNNAPAPGRVLAMTSSNGVDFEPRNTTAAQSSNVHGPPSESATVFMQRNIDVRYDRESRQHLMLEGDVGGKRIYTSLSNTSGQTWMPWLGSGDAMAAANRTIAVHNASCPVCNNHNPGLAALPDGSFGQRTLALVASSNSNPGKWGVWQLFRSDVGVGGLDCADCAPTGCDHLCSVRANKTMTGKCEYTESTDPDKCCSCEEYVEESAGGCVERCRAQGQLAGVAAWNSTSCECFSRGAKTDDFEMSIKPGSLPLYPWFDSGPANSLPMFAALFGSGEAHQHPNPVAAPTAPLGDPANTLAQWGLDAPPEVYNGSLLSSCCSRVLPYRLNDLYRSEDKYNTPRHHDIDTIVLETSTLRAHVAPLQGGKIWQLLHKATGTQLLFNNQGHLPLTDSPTNAQTVGGLEWNWSPGLIGHTASRPSSRCTLHASARLVATSSAYMTMIDTTRPSGKWTCSWPMVRCGCTSRWRTRIRARCQGSTGRSLRSRGRRRSCTWIEPTMLAPTARTARTRSRGRAETCRSAARRMGAVARGFSSRRTMWSARRRREGALRARRGLVITPLAPLET